MDLDSLTLTAEGAAQLLQPDEAFYLHRHAGDHDEEDCWCEPLLLTYERVSAMTLAELQSVLDGFFAVH